MAAQQRMNKPPLMEFGSYAYQSFPDNPTFNPLGTHYRDGYNDKPGRLYYAIENSGISMTKFLKDLKITGPDFSRCTSYLKGQMEFSSLPKYVQKRLQVGAASLGIML